MVLLAVLGLLGLAAGRSVVILACGAVVLGLAYGAIAPASAHLSFGAANAKGGLQSGHVVASDWRAAGWSLGALIVPPISVTVGAWPWPRRQDRCSRCCWPAVAARKVGCRSSAGSPVIEWNCLSAATPAPGGRAGVASVGRQPGVLWCAALLCCVYHVQLTSTAQLDLVRAGFALAVYQIAGACTRPLWGWVADRYFTAAHTIALLESEWLSPPCLWAGSALAGRSPQSWPWRCSAGPRLADIRGWPTPSMRGWVVYGEPRLPVWARPRCSQAWRYSRRRLPPQRACLGDIRCSMTGWQLLRLHRRCCFWDGLANHLVPLHATWRPADGTPRQ